MSPPGIAVAAAAVVVFVFLKRFIVEKVKVLLEFY